MRRFLEIIVGVLVCAACEAEKVPIAPAGLVSSAPDLDGDGFSEDSDCDDLDATRSPAMPEIPYDGRDNDCDPETVDDDGDGDGVRYAEDCDDSDPERWANDNTLVVVDAVEPEFCDGYCMRQAARVSVPADATALTYLRCLVMAEELYIQDVEQLESLRGLEQLSIVRVADLSGLPALADARALSGLSTVGALRISGADVLDAIPSMPALEHIEDLTILQNPSLESWGDLGALKTVTGTLKISQNDALDALPAMPSLQVISGDLEVTGNGVLKDLVGLEGLGVIEGDLRIADNPEMSSLAGLEGLGAVLGDVTISYNDALRSLSSLSGLQRTDAVTLSELEALSSLEGLHNLTWVSSVTVMATGATDLSGLRGAESLDALIVHDNAQLTAPGAVGWSGAVGDLTFTSNGGLESLDGLEGLTALDSLTISANPKLSEIAGLSGVTDIEDEVTIANNHVLGDLRGLGSVSSVGEVTLQGNLLLSNIGWDRLYRSGGVLIEGNPSLELSEAFGALVEISGDLQVLNNDGAVGVGFSSLEEISGDLWLQGNDGLEGIETLSLLESVGGDVLVWGNARLLDADAAVVLDAIPVVSGVVVVDGNGLGL